MTRRLIPLALPALCALAACQPGVATYTAAQAPNDLRLDSAARERTVRFVPGSDRLSPGEAARLSYLAASGAIRPSDRVVVAASGPPPLAARREAAVAHALLRYGIVAYPQVLAAVPPNRALVSVGRYTVTLPPCPNWSKRPYSDFTNQPSSNYGCATTVNLGLMAASPADLANGLPLARADGEPAVSAVERYQKDKVYPPSPAGTPTPFSGGASSSGGGGGGGTP
ncbi:MAG TPA: CpaD family pilus assembly lipoprotein [Stellaceae bacterium]|nr:CpaD family pilus assembly lipoprotein [Stellaceae bacterium]